MRKIVAIAQLTGVLFAQSGEEIYKSKCMACHKIIDMKAQKKKMMQLSMAERKAAKAEFMRSMVAPPMNKVSARIKKFHPKKDDFIAFVSEYIVNPDRKKALCMPMALKRFGVMPPIGKTMSHDEIQTVAAWLYENFHEKWQEMQACAAKKGDKGGMKMKCGSGKCGM